MLFTLLFATTNNRSINNNSNRDKSQDAVADNEKKNRENNWNAQ